VLIRSIFLVLIFFGIQVSQLVAQNDSIPSQSEDDTVIDTRQIDQQMVAPTSTKKPVGDRSPFRNRRFNPNYGIRSFFNRFTFTPLLGYSRTYYREKVSSTETASDFNGWGIPISGTLNFHIDRFRLGGGAALEFHNIKEDDIGIAQGIINDKSTMFTKFYGNLGAEVFQYWDYMLVPEVQVGKMKLGKGFNTDSVSNGMFINLGVSVEKELSEYFRVILKPSYELRNLEKTGAEPMDYKMNAFTIKLGVSIRYPDLPRCPLKACHTQIKHIHYGNEYRGQPLPIEQYRGYGELNPTLKKYKGRNKKKLNPY
jgi:hypothetical protein